MSHIVVNGQIILFGGHSFCTDTNHSYVQTFNVLSTDVAGHANLTSASHKTINNVDSIEFNAREIKFFSVNILQLSRIYVEKFHWFSLIIKKD